MLRTPAVLRGALPAALRGAARPCAPGGSVGPGRQSRRTSPARAAAGGSADNGAPRGGSRRKPRGASVDAPSPPPPPPAELVEALVSGLPYTALDDPASSFAGGLMQEVPQLSPSFAFEITMPATVMKGMQLDCTDLSIEEMCTSDAVYNHEMSWIAFNWRVLAMAMDPATPLFERLRFVAIASRNLDEFFAKRVGALKRQEAAGVENLLKKRDKSIWTPGEQLRLISRAVQEMDECIAQTLLGDVLPKLREAGVFMLDYDELTEEERAELREWFTEKVEPLLTPLAVDPGHPFPAIGSLTLSIAVELMDEYEEAAVGGGFEKHKHFAIVTVPSGLSRWMRLSARGPNAFIPVEQIIIANLDRLFGGMLVLSANMFRPTRNADVVRNEEEAEDLLEMMSDEVRERRFAPFVRLEVEASMPMELVMRVVEEMALTPQDVFTVSAGPVGLGELDSLPVQFGMDQSLLYSHWAPATHTRLMNVKKKASSDGRSESIFAAIRRGDILVHHPYHSFATSTQLFVESAARDPAVVAIKATLYRTSSDSPIINALAVAAEAGKQVAVLVELKARFDEARNVGFANKLEDAGCNVAYGLVGLKTHCKAMLVVRQEEDGLRTYVHLGTGNYNPRTASLYTDVGLLSCDPDLGADVSDLFKYLTGYHRQTAYRKLLVAPNNMRRQFCELIDAEIAHARAGRPAGITAKMNGLDDRLLVEKLYQAAAAGVKIDLVVRGICRMRPGVPGLSENVRVVSIIGRFLEHHRIFRFENGGQPHFFTGSADWMSRNLTRRVEVCTPITNDVLKAQLQALLDACLSDGMNAWEMLPDGRYHKPSRICAEHKAYGDDRLAQRAKEVGLHSALIEATMRETLEVARSQYFSVSGAPVPGFPATKRELKDAEKQDRGGLDRPQVVRKKTLRNRGA